MTRPIEAQDGPVGAEGHGTRGTTPRFNFPGGYGLATGIVTLLDLALIERMVAFYRRLINLMDIVVFLFKCFFIYLGIAWRCFFPRKKRCVAGEVALITGAGNGIGRDLALQMGRLGAIIGKSCHDYVLYFSNPLLFTRTFACGKSGCVSNDILSIQSVSTSRKTTTTKR